MPIYPYLCNDCGHEFDRLQKISDAPLTVCPECGAESLKKKLTAAAFQLKGTGWYETDFKNNDKKSDKKSDGDQTKNKDSKSTNGKKESDGGASKSGETKSGSASSTSEKSNSGSKSKASSAESG